MKFYKKQLTVTYPFSLHPLPIFVTQKARHLVRLHAWPLPTFVPDITGRCPNFVTNNKSE